MLLKDKNAVVYGGGGSIGGAVARAFAREGAHVFLAGRTETKLEAVAAEIRAAGGTAHTAKLDALDAAQIDAHAETVGRIDISFNAIGHNDIQGTPMAEMDVDDYLSPILTGARTNFLTWKAAAKHGAQRDPGLRRLRPADGRLQPRRPADGPRGARVDAPPVLGRERQARHPRRHAAHRRRRRLDPARLRRPRRAGQEPRGHDDARHPGHASRTSATSPPSWPPTAPAR